MKYNRIIWFIAAMALITTAVPSNAQQTSVAGKTLSGKAYGYHGWVNVSVDVDTHKKITSVTVDENHHETFGVGTVAINKIGRKIVAKQSLDIDAVTGASMTSKAIVQAVANALQGTDLDPSSLGYVAPAEKN